MFYGVCGGRRIHKHIAYIYIVHVYTYNEWSAVKAKFNQSVSPMGGFPLTAIVYSSIFYMGIDWLIGFVCVFFFIELGVELLWP